MSETSAAPALDEVEDRLQQQLAAVRAERGKPTEAEADASQEADPLPDPALVPEPGKPWQLNTRGGSAPPYQFFVDGEEMYAAPVMPAGYAIDMMERRDELRSSETSRSAQFDTMLSMLRSLLLPESMEIIEERMRDPEHAIEVEDLASILNHLTTVVYRRPTRQSSDSPEEQSTTGTTSTAGALPDSSTSEPSQTTAASST